MDAKLKRAAEISVIIVGAAVVLGWAKGYILGAVIPFLFAWGSALVYRRPSERIAKALHINERATRLIFAMLVTAAVLSSICLIIWYIVNKGWQFLNNIADNDGIVGTFDNMMSNGFLPDFIFDSELGRYIESCLGALVSSLLSSLGEGISEFARRIPSAFVFLLVTVIATAYFAYDLEGINAAVLSVMPKRAAAFALRLKRAFLSVGVRYLRSYLVIMSVTFLVLLVGFLLLRVEYAALIALIIALLDILPVLGVGTVLVPWSIIAFISADVKRGIGLLALFLIITVLREIIEPKILGKNLGLHPLLTLLLLYLGYSFFGIFGMVLLPPLGALAVIMLREPLNENNSSEVV